MRKRILGQSDTLHQDVMEDTSFNGASSFSNDALQTTSALPFSRVHCMVAAEPYIALACGNRIARLFVENDRTRSSFSAHEASTTSRALRKSYSELDDEGTDDDVDELYEQKCWTGEPCNVS
jgi:hypothetical protein